MFTTLSCEKRNHRDGSKLKTSRAVARRSPVLFWKNSLAIQKSVYLYITYKHCIELLATFLCNFRSQLSFATFLRNFPTQLSYATSASNFPLHLPLATFLHNFLTQLFASNFPLQLPLATFLCNFLLQLFFAVLMSPIVP